MSSNWRIRIVALEILRGSRVLVAIAFVLSTCDLVLNLRRESMYYVMIDVPLVTIWILVLFKQTRMLHRIEGGEGG